MQANCVISLSGRVEQELLPLQDLMELDKKTSKLYQNEDALRKDSRLKPQIDQFLWSKLAYRNKITDPVKRQGKIALEYTGNDGNSYYLAPIYQDDLKALKMKEFSRETFVKKMVNKTIAYLKEQDWETVDRFFYRHAFLFVSTYYIKQGYNNWIRDLSSSNARRKKAESKLFAMMKECLNTEKKENASRVYFGARVLFHYAKKQDFLSATLPMHASVEIKTTAPFMEPVTLVKQPKEMLDASIKNHTNDSGQQLTWAFLDKNSQNKGNHYHG